MDENNSIRVCGTLLLILIPNAADYMLNTITNRPLTRALVDNLTHGILGAVTWLIYDPASVTSLLSMSTTTTTTTWPTLKSWRSCTSLLSVFILSSLIDLDHFLSARSLQLRDALRAPHRGIFHCSGLMLLINILLVGLNSHWALIFLVSWIPHHLRDASRRGLFLFPSPYDQGASQVHTEPLPVNVVYLSTIALPWLLYFISRSKRLSVLFYPNHYQPILQQQVFSV